MMRSYRDEAEGLQTPDISGVKERALESIGSGAVWISGSTGSGRSMVLRDLREQLADSVCIDLPPLDEADAGAALLLSLVTAVPDKDDRHEILARPLDERIRLAVRRIDALGRVPLIRLPASWGVYFGDESDDRRARARGALAALGSLRAVWVADTGVDPSKLGISVAERLELGVHRVSLPKGVWGDYEPHAHRLVGMVNADILASPVVWRLAVGTVALGADPGDVAARCQQSPSQAITGLVDLLRTAFSHEHRIRDAVRRFVQIRRPLARDEVLAVVRPPEGSETLFTECLAYGEPLRASQSVRKRLLNLYRPAPKRLEQAHAELGSTYESLDGVEDPASVADPEHLIYWLEKVHHLGRGGESSVSTWARQDLPTPELYWDRARFLSIHEKNFDAAAEVYRACQERFPTDDYSAHYLAWNLEHAGQRGDCASWYARATELAPANPWWNARRISFLISTKDYRGAKAAWRSALGNADPDGLRVQEDPWFVAHFHYWVAKAWLEAGLYAEARAVLEGLSDDALSRAQRARPQLKNLIRKVRAKEAEQLSQFDAWMTAQEPTTRKRLRKVWRELSSEVPGISVPAGLPLEEGEGVQLAWSHPAYHVELDLLDNGWFEWFARDRLRDRFDGTDAPVKSVPKELINWLQRVRHG